MKRHPLARLTPLLLIALLVFPALLSGCKSGSDFERETQDQGARLTQAGPKTATPTATPLPTRTPTPSLSSAKTPQEGALNSFKAWAAPQHGLQIRNVRTTVLANDNNQASVRVNAEFRNSATAAWVDNEAKLNCKDNGGRWECANDFQFAPSATPTPSG